MQFHHRTLDLLKPVTTKFTKQELDLLSRRKFETPIVPIDNEVKMLTNHSNQEYLRLKRQRDMHKTQTFAFNENGNFKK